MHKIGFIHSFQLTLSLVDNLMKKYVSNAIAIHIMDECIKKSNSECEIGTTPDKNIERYMYYAKQLKDEGCDLIFSVCSLMDDAVLAIREKLGCEIYQLDEWCIRNAINNHNNVLVLAANPRVKPHVIKQINRFNNNPNLKYDVLINKEAYKAMSLGNNELHDKLLIDSINTTNEQYDAILLGQINLALLEDKINIPVYCSGKETFKFIEELINGRYN